jgi:hypothetical protein
MKRVVLILLALCLASTIFAQPQKKPAVETSPLCTRDNAVDTTKQQILLSRTFDNAVQRIAVLLRAADLLWPHEQEKALTAFMEAFDLAVQNFKEKGDEVRRTSQSQFAARIAVPDQRFKVMSALAKRDPAKARKMSKELLQDHAREAAGNPAADAESKSRMAEKLLLMAHGLASTDAASAINFARQSFKYPATMYLPMFTYELAKTNKSAADQFYLQSLAAYSSSPMDQFLYLSAYPFGNTRDAGVMPGSTVYRIPEGYTPDLTLQRQFVQALLGRTERAQQQQVEAISDYRLSEPAQMSVALTRLEKQVQANLPDLADAVAQSRDRLLPLLDTRVQSRVNDFINADDAPRKSFDDQVELAEKLSNVDRRDQMLSTAVTGLSKDQPVEKVISVIDKISDAGVRASLLNWFYYFRTQALIAEKNLIEARKFASKVTELDQRAYLFTRIAEESLKVAEDQTEVREMLNEIANDVSKAPKTIVSARALLALAHLYTKVDVNRGVEELGNAVKTINGLESPDFSLQFVMMKIEGKSFGSYAAFSTPGFNPENALREMGKIDFDGSLAQAATFTDKSLRALTTLSVIEPCFATKSRKTSK